jgi:hypothetical protein
VVPEDIKVKLVLQLKKLYPGGGKQVAAMLKQLISQKARCDSLRVYHKFILYLRSRHEPAGR